MGTRRGQKTRFSLVVAGGSRGIILSSLQDFVFSVWKIHSCHDFSGQ